MSLGLTSVSCSIRKRRADREREVEDLALAGQRLADIQALHCQGGVTFNHCGHSFILLNQERESEDFGCSHMLVTRKAIEGPKNSAFTAPVTTLKFWGI